MTCIFFKRVRGGFSTHISCKTRSARLQAGHYLGWASFLWPYTLLPLPHVIKTSLNFLRGLTCAIIGAASIPSQLHCLAPIQDGGVNKETHVRPMFSLAQLLSKGPPSADRDMGLERRAWGEESHYGPQGAWLLEQRFRHDWFVLWGVNNKLHWMLRHPCLHVGFPSPSSSSFWPQLDCDPLCCDCGHQFFMIR